MTTPAYLCPHCRRTQGALCSTCPRRRPPEMYVGVIYGVTLVDAEPTATTGTARLMEWTEAEFNGA